MLIMYGIKNCDTVKKARKWLDAQGVSYEFHDYKSQGISSELAAELIRELGFEALINKRGTTWRALDDTTKATLNAQTAQELMLANPSIIKRPILATGQEKVLGFSEALYSQHFLKA